MARIARVVLPGYPHHVTQRGNRRQKVFFCESDYDYYLSSIADSCQRSGTICLAYCLMPNHVHLILTPDCEDGLRSALAEAHRRFTRMINFREGWRGHLWQERFYSFPMNEAHLSAAMRYVELNPVRAKLVSHAKDWKWSSANAHLAGVNDTLVTVEPMLSLYPDWNNFLSGYKQDDMESLRKHSRTGRPLGDAHFIEAAEYITGRILSIQKPGRKPSSILDTTIKK